ncbi:MAG TPA: hypothetical protein VMI93_16020 [Candidatus Solibacter sp.]|nr:hypothetical protein [Candidatus Solibacter sp.]
MRDFAAIVRRNLGSLPLGGEREQEIVTELAHQLEDCYQEAREAGTPEARALAVALAQFGDWAEVRRGILSSEMGAAIMWPHPGAVSRRAGWAALAVVAVLCVIPSFRQAMRVAPVAWSMSLGSISDEEMGAAAERGVKEHDAALVAFAALHLSDALTASQYAEQVITMDPSYTWVSTRFVRSLDARVDGKPWIARLAAWDPANALPRMMSADAIYERWLPEVPFSGTLYDPAVAHLAETTAWGEKMRTAIAAPRYDSYDAQRFELDRSVVERLRGTRTDALVRYSTQYSLSPNLGALMAYAGLVTRKLGPEAERAGRNAEAEGIYWNQVRFGERLEKGAMWEFEREAGWNLEASGLTSLASLAERTGNKAEAVALEMLREQVNREKAEARRTWQTVSRSNWRAAEYPALVAWVASWAVLLSGLGCLAWLALLGFRREDRVLGGWPGAFAKCVSYAPAAFVSSAAIMCTAMLPYLRSPKDFASRREVFNALAPFWFGFWSGWGALGEWRIYLREMLVPGLISVVILIAGLSMLRWMARARSAHAPAGE